MRLQKGPDLAGLKVSLGRQVDAEAEAERLKYITPGSGQAMMYLEKESEARALKSGKAAPMLARIAEITGRTAEAIADEIIATSDQWRTIAAEIEGRRMAAKGAINAATTVTEARRAAQVNWSLA